MNGSRRRGARGLPRGIGLAFSILAFGVFAVFLVLRLQAGFERRAAEWFESVEEVPEETEEVVSEAIEFTRFDAQGRPVLRGLAEQALGPSDGQQRFLGVEVRLLDVYAEGDAVVAADEMLIDTRTEALEFLGNALLRVEGLELSGPHLHFRRAPDRLWSRDPVQFQSDDFVGIAASMQFDIERGGVSLSGVVAAPAGDLGLSVVAERVRFDRETRDTTLMGEVEIASERLTLTSRESVVARRDHELDQMRSLEAGFGSELRMMPEGQAGADPDDPAAPSLTLNGDALEVSLENGETPREIRITENPLFAGADGAELRGSEAILELDPDGRPERLRLAGNVTSRLPAGKGGEESPQEPIRVDSELLEVEFDEDGALSGAHFTQDIQARRGRALATAERARWDGADTLTLTGAPRIVDSSLLELEAGDLRLIAGGSTRVEAADAVTARFLSERLAWLPGTFDSVVLTGATAVVEAGTGRGAFTGDVRLLFGRNRLSAGEVEVDAEAQALAASGDVRTALEFDLPDPEASEPAAGDPAAGNSPAGDSPTGDSSSSDPAGRAPDDSPETSSPFAFAARADRFHYDAAAGRLAYEGSPRLEREEPSGDVSSLTAGSIVGDLGPDGSLRAVRGIQAARFERGDNVVRGSRVRFEPADDVLSAWGAPAVISIEGRSSEGGFLELSLADDRSNLHPSQAGRPVTRVRIANPEPGGAR